MSRFQGRNGKEKKMSCHRMNMRLTAALLSCLLVCAVSGCGENGSGGASPDADVQTSSAVTSEATTDASTEVSSEISADESIVTSEDTTTENLTSTTTDTDTSEASTEAATEDDTPADETVLPFNESQNLVFSSGAGGWSTTLTLNPDGSFTGSYSDSDMGTSGAGYDATMYVCDFKGAFSNITKVDDYTYSMTLANLTTDSYTSSEWIEEIDGANVRYVVGTAYGIDGGTTFYLYLPGTAVSGLPQPYVEWYTPLGMGDSPTLTSYGLYNVDEELGFY